MSSSYFIQETPPCKSGVCAYFNIEYHSFWTKENLLSVATSLSVVKRKIYSLFTQNARKVNVEVQYSGTR